MRDRGSMKIVLALVLSLAAAASAARRVWSSCPSWPRSRAVGPAWARCGGTPSTWPSRTSTGRAASSGCAWRPVCKTRRRTADLGGRHAPRAQRQAVRRLRHGVQFEHRGRHGHRAPGRHPAVHRLGVWWIITQKGNDNIFLTSFGQDVGMAKEVRWLLDDLKAGGDRPDLGEQRLRQGRAGHVRAVLEGAREGPGGRHRHRSPSRPISRRS